MTYFVPDNSRGGRKCEWIMFSPTIDNKIPFVSLFSKAKDSFKMIR